MKIWALKELGDFNTVIIGVFDSERKALDARLALWAAVNPKKYEIEEVEE